MIKVVVDTNVIISAIFWDGKPYRVISDGLQGKYTIVTSPEIIDEVVSKLRDKFGFPEDRIDEYINILLTLFNVVNPADKINVVRDKNDNKIIECALDCKADFIVTGDSDLLEIKEFHGVKIVTPNGFLKR